MTTTATAGDSPKGWLLVNAGTEVVVSEHATEAEAVAAWHRRQLGSFPVYRVQERYRSRYS